MTTEERETFVKDFQQAVSGEAEELMSIITTTDEDSIKSALRLAFIGGANWAYLDAARSI
jgi:hypothetical protein